MWADWQHVRTFDTGIQSPSGEGGATSSSRSWDSKEWKWKFVADNCSDEKCVGKKQDKTLFLSVGEISKVVSRAMTEGRCHKNIVQIYEWVNNCFYHFNIIVCIKTNAATAAGEAPVTVNVLDW